MAKSVTVFALTALVVLHFGVPCQVCAQIIRIPIAKPKPASANETQGKGSTSSPIATAPSGPIKAETSKSDLTLDSLKIPPGTVVVVTDEVKNAFKPKSVVLSAEEYQRLLEQIETLKRQLNPDAPGIPSVCKISGKLEGDLVTLQIDFELRTDRPNSLINLGCKHAWPTAASLDGEIPWLQSGDDGFLVLIEKPGAHKVRLDLLVVGKKGTRSGTSTLDLDLPRAAITLLERLDVPAGIQEVRVGDRPVKPKQVSETLGRLEFIPITPIDRLDLAWKSANSDPATAPPLAAASTRTVVRVQESQILTEVEFTLETLRGAVSQWTLRTPAQLNWQSELRPQPQDEVRLQPILATSLKDSIEYSVRLKEAGSRAVHVVLQLRQPRHGGKIAVGPFVVANAFMQRGELEIRGQDEVRLRWQAQPEIQQRELTDEQRRENVRAAFAYRRQGTKVDPKLELQPWLELEVETVRGAAEAKTSHHFTLSDGEAAAAPQWRLATRIEVTPLRSGVDRIDLTLPRGFEYDRQVGASPTEIVEAVVVDPQSKSLQIKLAQKQFRPFSVGITGSYFLQPGTQETNLFLPQPATWFADRVPLNVKESGFPQSMPLLDRGGQITVTLPDSMELISRPVRSRGEGSSRPFGALLFSGRPKETPRDYTWQVDRAPAQIELAWRQRLADLLVDSVVDVSLSESSATVLHQLHLRFADASARRLQFRVPAGVVDPIRIVQGGGRGTEESRQADTFAMTVAPDSSRVGAVTLEYTVGLGATQDRGGASSEKITLADQSRARFVLPLLRALGISPGQTKVRFWSDSGIRLQADDGDWVTCATEFVAEKDALPSLVLRGHGDMQMLLKLSRQDKSGVVSSVLDRVLATVSLVPERFIGQFPWSVRQDCRFRFFFLKVSRRILDIQLPLPYSLSSLEARINGKKVLPSLLDDAGNATEVGKILRVPVEPTLFRGPVVLELSYTVDADRAGSSGPFSAVLLPPLILDAVMLGRVQWQVDLPAGWMPLYTGAGHRMWQHWEWSGWFLMPRPSLGRNDLEKWFQESASPSNGVDVPVDLVCSNSDLVNLPIVLFPHRLWQLFCSILLLVAGMVLISDKISRVFFWLCVILLAAGPFGVAVNCPDALSAVVYGIQPGFLILGAIIVLKWTLHARNRRQVVFMPGFTRTRSSGSQQGGSSIRPRPPSTIDAPPIRADEAAAEMKLS